MPTEAVGLGHGPGQQLGWHPAAALLPRWALGRTPPRGLRFSYAALALRKDLRAEEERLAAGRLDLARRYQDVEHVKVPRDEFARWFGEVPDAP